MKIEGIPDGWELVRIGIPNIGEWIIASDGELHVVSKCVRAYCYPIIRKVEKPKRYRPFANAEEFKSHRDRWLRLADANADCLKRYVKAVVVYENGTLSDEWCVLFKKYVFDDDGTPFGIEIKD